MPVDIQINEADDNEAKLRRVFWGRSNRVVRSRAHTLPDLATLSPPAEDTEAFIVEESDLTAPNEIVIWDDANSAFIRLGPTQGLEEGWEAYVQDENIRVRFDGSDWQVIASGSGDMLAATYDPGTVAGDVFDQDNMLDGTTNKNFTATEKTKLAGIESLADVTDAVNVASSIHGVSTKATPVDNDEFGLIDSAASNVLKRVLWSAVKATLKTYFDSLYASVSGSFTAASTTEVLTGTDTTKGVTADALAALWEKGADEASAGTVAFGEGGYFHITGTTGITDIDWDTAKDGRMAWVIFDGILTLTHHATTLKLPGGANITTAAGDRALFVQDATDNVICLDYIRADGKPLIPSVVGTPFELEIAVSDESTALTTGTAKASFFAQMDATITEVFTGVSAAQSSSGVVTSDLNKNGSTMFSTNPSIDASENTSLTGTAAVLSTTTWTKGDKMTIDIDAAGTGAKGLKMIVRGTRL